MDIAALLRGCEERLLEDSVRKNPEMVASMLDDDFQEFGSSGRIFDKQQTIAMLESEPPISISLRNFQARLLTDEIALVTYLTSKADAEGGMTHALRSSIWVSREGNWKILFHQGTKTSQPDVIKITANEGKEEL